jgi:hypothetical protein
MTKQVNTAPVQNCMVVDIVEKARESGFNVGSGWGAMRSVAQDITNELGGGWQRLKASGLKGNEVARYASIQCVLEAYRAGFIAGAVQKGMDEDKAKAKASRGLQLLKEHADNIDAEKLAQAEVEEMQARIDAGEDVEEVEAEAAAARGAQDAKVWRDTALAGASKLMREALIYRGGRDAMKMDQDNVLDDAIAAFIDAVLGLGGEEATKAVYDAVAKKLKATAPIE